MNAKRKIANAAALELAFRTFRSFLVRISFSLTLLVSLLNPTHDQRRRVSHPSLTAFKGVGFCNLFCSWHSFLIESIRVENTQKKQIPAFFRQLFTYRFVGLKQKR